MPNPCLAPESRSFVTQQRTLTPSFGWA